MTAVFADTAFYVALHNRRDSLHARAVELAAKLTGPVVTSEFILIEVANFFKRPGDRESFAAFDAALRTDAGTTIVPASSQLYALGLQLFATRPDHAWSLVDCTSFQIMADHEITDALAADEDFEQAGFRALLREEKS